MGASRTLDARASRNRSVTSVTVEGLRTRTVVFGPLLVVLVTSLALLLLATPYGLGVSPDSTQYLSAAENFLRGDGLRRGS